MSSLGPLPDSSARIALAGLAAGGQGAPTAGSADNRLRATAEEFEAVFLSVMFKQMFSGLDAKGPFGGGHGEEVFRELLADEYAKEIARGGGVGLADEVYREMLALQEIEP